METLLVLPLTARFGILSFRDSVFGGLSLFVLFVLPFRLTPGEMVGEGFSDDVIVCLSRFEAAESDRPSGED